MKKSILTTAILCGVLSLSLNAAQAATILVDFAGGSADGSAVANTNSLNGSGTQTSVTDSSIVELDGTPVTGMTITGTGTSTLADKIHVNGAGAKLLSTTVDNDSVIDAAFSAYQNAYSSSWGPENAGVGNGYNIDLIGLLAGNTYTVKIISGRNGGIALPTGQFSKLTVTAGAATLDGANSIYREWNNATSSVVTDEESGTGPFQFDYGLVLNDVGMTTWVFDVTQANTNIQLGFLSPINAMTIDVVPVPEPGTAGLLGLGALALTMLRRRRA